MGGMVVRRGGPADFGSAVEVWRAANEARLGGRASPPTVQLERLHAALREPDSFLFVADDGDISGMAVGMQGLADDGAGPPIGDLCHVGAVFVAPERWGAGLGGELVEAVLFEARSRGYGRAQLWTHADNPRAQRLYEGRGFRRTGREKQDDLGETIVYLERDLWTPARRPGRTRRPATSTRGGSREQERVARVARDEQG
jgi:GNAT superfamily N-acetyltransferase